MHLPETTDLGGEWTISAEGERTLDEVGAGLGEDGSRLLESWGWQENVYRDFIRDDASDETSFFLSASIHRFASSDGAAEGMAYFADLVQQEPGRTEVEVVPIGDATHALVWSQGGANFAVVYVRVETTVIRIGGSSLLGDPLPNVLALAERMVNGAPSAAALEPFALTVVQNYSGEGTDVLEVIALISGLLRSTATHAGEGAFVVVLLAPDGSPEVLFDESGRFDGQATLAVPATGQYRVLITADGDWTLTLEQQALATPTATPSSQDYEATIAALETVAADSAATATAFAGSAPSGSIDPTLVTMSIEVDAKQLIDGDRDAIDEASKTLTETLEPYDGCRVGLALISGWSSDLQTGLAVSDAISDILQDDFSEQFGEAAFQNFASLQAPSGRVDLELYFYRGCESLQ